MKHRVRPFSRMRWILVAGCTRVHLLREALSTVLHVIAQADGNSTGVGNPPGYCYKEQPAWSLYRESSFGHGTLDLINGTHALWSCEPLPLYFPTVSKLPEYAIDW